MAAVGFNVQSIAVQDRVDSVNISEEMSKTALWKSILSNESSSNLISQGEKLDEEEGQRHKK